MSTAEREVASGLLERMRALGRAARAACDELGRVSAEARTKAFVAAAARLRGASAGILDASRADGAQAGTRGPSAAMIDRLALDEKRTEAMAAGVAAIAALPEPIGRVIAEWERPNGLKIQRVRV